MLRILILDIPEIRAWQESEPMEKWFGFQSGCYSRNAIFSLFKDRFWLPLNYRYSQWSLLEINIDFSFSLSFIVNAIVPPLFVFSSLVGGGVRGSIERMSTFYLHLVKFQVHHQFKMILTTLPFGQCMMKLSISICFWKTFKNWSELPANVSINSSSLGLFIMVLFDFL